MTSTCSTVPDGQIPEREQTHGTVQGAGPDRGADQDVVPEPKDQVEEAAGVQVEDRTPARLFPAGAALRVAVRAALLFPRVGGSDVRRISQLSSKLRLRRRPVTSPSAADVRATARTSLSGTRRARTRRRASPQIILSRGRYAGPVRFLSFEEGARGMIRGGLPPETRPLLITAFCRCTSVLYCNHTCKKCIFYIYIMSVATSGKIVR